MRDLYSHSFRIRDRLSYRQTLLSVSIAVILGTIFSLSQIYFDYKEQAEKLDATVEQVLSIIELPASQAAYSLDKDFAAELISGLFEYQPIYAAYITDDLGNILAKTQGSKKEGWLRPVTDAIFGYDKVYRIPLKILPLPVSFFEMGNVIPVGELTVKVDTLTIGVEFIKRSLFVFFSGLLRNLILSLILLIFFHFLLTKPFLNIEAEFLKIDPRYPGRRQLEVPKGHEKDEFARMVKAANNLLSAIRQHVKERVQSISESERMQGELIERKRREQELEAIKAQLESTNNDLTNTLEELKATQSRLVQSERMAALGEVTASLAHEINTPLGLGVSGASHLFDELNNFKNQYETGEINRTEFEDFLNAGLEISDLITSNLRKSFQLIKSFKQVAVDQVSEAKRLFKVKPYTEQVLKSLGNIISKSGHLVEVVCDENLEINGYAGAFSQILTNLVLNSIVHGFEDGRTGWIKLQFTEKDGRILFTYSDNGKGIPKDVQQKIYDPFFTTKSKGGGTGLGMHIVYNLVINQFQGTIECESDIGKGTVFLLDLVKDNAA